MLAFAAQLVADINPFSAGQGQTEIVQVGETAYFFADNGTHGVELWKTDRTAAGTVLVKDIHEGANGSYPSHLINVGGILFFRADDGIHGNELWKTDGTADGTILVKDIRPGSLGSLGFADSPYFGTIANVGGTLFFNASPDIFNNHAELWKSDGTETGTVRVMEFPDALVGPRNFTDVHGTLYFGFEGFGGSLWKSDGTTAGTVTVNDPNVPVRPDDLTNVNGTLFFSGTDRIHDEELWKSDGTTAGTVMVKDILAPFGPSYPTNLTNVDGTLFFTTHDVINGRRLWRSDGTPEGTILLENLGPSGSNIVTDLTNVNGTLFFMHVGEAGRQLWRSDGTAIGTFAIKDFSYGSNDAVFSQLTNVGGTLLFAAKDEQHGRELWTSDGTSSGTFLVKDIQAGQQGSYPFNLANDNGVLLFTSNDGLHGFELWSADPSRFVNTPPSFVKGPDLSVIAISGLQSFPGWASDISQGTPDESAQSVTFIVANNNKSLFAVQPAIDSTGRLTFAPAPGASGSATVTVVLKDNGGTLGGGDDTSEPQTFTITVTPSSSPAGSVRLHFGVLEIVGTPQRDKLTLALSHNKVQVSGTMGTRRISQAFRYSGLERITAELGGGNDSLTIAKSLCVPVFVDSGAGNDAVTAGCGPAILVGGSGNDVLKGGAGRDIIIGGTGRDALSGGGASDLVLSGTTAYDQSQQALFAIQQVWNTAASVVLRSAAVRNGSSLLLASLGVRLRPNETVFEDSDVDALFGGADLDWFLNDRAKDKIKDRHRLEVSG
jgi:ELWxxDGT repeat protein